MGHTFSPSTWEAETLCEFKARMVYIIRPAGLRSIERPVSKKVKKRKLVISSQVWWDISIIPALDMRVKIRGSRSALTIL